MKFSCDKSKICEAINHVSKAVAVKSTIPALEVLKLNFQKIYWSLQVMIWKWVYELRYRLNLKIQVNM